MTKNRSRKPAKGMTVVELAVSMAILALLTGPIFQAFLSLQRASTNEETRLSQFQPARGAFNQMVREIQMAGYPAKNNFPPAIKTQSPGLIAAGFVTATATSIVFESDLDFDGTVERVKYSVAADGLSIARSVYPKAKNGSVGSAVSIQDPFISNLSGNPASPVFSWETDPASVQTFPNNISLVYVSLAFQLTPNPLKPASKETMILSGSARRVVPFL